MPLNCSRYMLKYNDCLDCRYRTKNECWANSPVSLKLADILTNEERIAILEDRKEVPEVNIVTITHEDYQQLQRLILILKEKVEKHVGETKKKKSKFDD